MCTVHYCIYFHVVDILHIFLMISVCQAHNGYLLGSSAVVLRDEVVKALRQSWQTANLSHPVVVL